MCIVNTVVALCASCTAAFSLSGFMGGRFAPSTVQNATLAGGVAVGAIASLEMGLCTAAVLGAFGGMISTVGYQKLQPYLYEKLGLHDSCGVHNLHGLPGLFGSLASVVACAFIHDSSFHPNDKTTQAFAATRAHLHLHACTCTPARPTCDAGIPHGTAAGTQPRDALDGRGQRAARRAARDVPPTRG